MSEVNAFSTLLFFRLERFDSSKFVNSLLDGGLN